MIGPFSQWWFYVNYVSDGFLLALCETGQGRQGKVENTGWKGVRVGRMIFGALKVVAPAYVN
jgi:hypothetical protein